MSMMNIQEIIKYLPHRYPFLLIDRVIDVQAGKSLTAIKNISVNEAYFNGHFPNNPVMPGVLILEALAQASCILANKSVDTNANGSSLYLFAGIDNARFKRVIEPGDQLRLEVQLNRQKQSIWKFTGIATVDGEVACEADLICAKKEIKQ